MFGLGKKCVACDMEMPLTGDVCDYCGQKQSLATGSSVKRDPRFQRTLTHAPHGNSVPSATVNTQPQKQLSSTRTLNSTVIQNKVTTAAPAIQQTTARVLEVPERRDKLYTIKANPLPEKAKKVQIGCGGFIFRLALMVFWTFLLSEIINNFESRNLWAGEFDEWTGTLCAITGFLLVMTAGYKIFWRIVMIPYLFVSFAALLSKPHKYPILSEWTNAQGVVTSSPFSYTSETHLYFVIPGFILLALFGINFFGLIANLFRLVFGFFSSTHSKS